MRRYIVLILVFAVIVPPQITPSQSAHAEVDMTGEWRLDLYYPPGQFFNTRQVTFVQSGTALTMTDGTLPFTGSFDPTYNTFTLISYDFGVQQIQGVVSPDGNAFTGTWTVAGSPPLFASITGERKPPPAETPSPTARATPTSTPPAVGGAGFEVTRDKLEPRFGVWLLGSAGALAGVALLGWVAARRPSPK